MSVENEGEESEPEGSPSALFPEITEAEGKTLDRETVVILERRVRIMDLYRKRKTMTEIAGLERCAISTVHRDIHIVLDGYQRIAQQSAAKHLANMLQKMLWVEAEIIAEWEKSKGERIESYAENRPGRKGEPSAQSVKVKKKQAYGDPRLAALLQNCYRDQCKLLGLMSKEDFAGKDGMPPVKMVAGLDPVEAVG